MSGSEPRIAEAEQAIASAKRALANLAPPTKSGRAGGGLAGRVPPVKRWWLPIAMIFVLFVGQALVAALVDDTTIGAIFAVGAVIVAILAAIVAVLSYAQQAAVPLADILKILEQLLKALEALKDAEKKGGDGSEAPTEVDDNLREEPR
jgi:ABC-type multidrug transport system fused ATPase/permease subunit